MTTEPNASLHANAQFRRALLLGVAACGLFAAFLTLSLGGARATLWADDGGTVLMAGTAAVLSFRAARRQPERRQFWLILGMSLVCWTVGEAIWGVYELILRTEVPFPSIADVGYLAAIPFAVVAMAVYPTAEIRDTTSRIRAALDGLLIAASISFVSWAYLISPVLHEPGARGFGDWVSLAYPVGDVVIASVAIMAIHRCRSLGHGPLLFVAAGMLLNALSDSSYAYLTHIGKYLTGNFIDVGWFGAYALIALAAFVPARPSTRAKTLAVSIGDLVVPYIALSLAVAVASIKIASHQFNDEVLLWLAVFCVALVLVRQFVALSDNAALTRDLESKVQARTGQLAAKTDELTSALAVANEAVRVKTTFLANMSHEIRTPMNGVMGMLGLLLDRPLGDVERDYVETMGSSAESLMAIINDILDYSKLDAGRVEPEHVPFELRAAVEGAVAGIAGRAHPKGIELINMIDTDIPELVVGDRLRIRQILANLLDNAVKFSDTGDVVVRVANRRPGWVRFEVADSGMGISPTGRDRLFESFTQADVSTTRRFGGTGLGLAICKQLVELMGGEIGVESELGIGSTFWFTLPFEVAAAKVGPDEARESLNEIRVLLVGSHAVARAALAGQLRRETNRVVEAGEPALALELLMGAVERGEPFDVAVIDDHQAEGSQLDLARQIGANSALTYTRIVALATPAAIATTAPEVHGWVTKPVRNAALLDRLVAVRQIPREPHAVAKRPRPDVVAEITGPAPHPQANDAAHGTILVVEDNQINAKVAVAILEAMGYAADVAVDGIDAIEALARRRYDAVLMDVQMPRMNGNDATRAIRVGGDTTTPIIAMTASALEEDRVDSLAAGMNDYVPKPIDRALLAEVLHAQLQRRLTTS